MPITYAKVSPRGFANEYVIFAIPQVDMGEFEAEYGDLEDRGDGGFTHVYKNPQQWVKNLAVAWADRHWL